MIYLYSVCVRALIWYEKNIKTILNESMHHDAIIIYYYIIFSSRWFIIMEFVRQRSIETETG